MTLPLRAHFPTGAGKKPESGRRRPWLIRPPADTEAPSSWTPHSPTRRRERKARDRAALPPAQSCYSTLIGMLPAPQQGGWSDPLFQTGHSAPTPNPPTQGCPMPSPPGTQGNKAPGGLRVQSPEEGQERTVPEAHWVLCTGRQCSPHRPHAC